MPNFQPVEDSHSVEAFQRTGHSPQLSHDIFLYIMQFLSPLSLHGSGLLSFMKTCRTLYHASIPYVLLGTVKISGKPKHLESFNSFMKHDLTRRAHFLRKLCLDSPEYWEYRYYDNNSRIDESELHILQDFVQLLKHANHLHCFQLLGSEEWLEMDPELQNVIVSLQELDTLMISGLFERTRKLLKLCPPSIQAVGTSFFSGDTFDACMTGDPRPICQIMPHIHELEVRWLAFDWRKDGIVCAGVQTLSIEYWYEIGIESLIRSFPRLRHLQLYPCIGELHPSKDHELQEFRAENILSQAQLSQWKDLDYLEGELSALYALAPMCRITHLDVRTADFLKYWPLVVRDVSPTRVRLAIDIPFRDPERRVEELSNLVPPDDPAVLTHMELDIDVGYTNCDMNALESKILNALRLHRLSLIQIRFKMERLDWIKLDHQNVREYFRSLDPLTLATRILYCHPSNTSPLRYIVLCLPHQSHGSPLCWKVERRKEGPSLVLMPGDEGRRMLSSELPRFKSNVEKFNRMRYGY